MRKLIFDIAILLRPATKFITFIVWIKYVFMYMSQKTIRKRYKSNKKSYDEIKTLEELQDWFRLKYRYSSDVWNGLADHDNSQLEFFIKFGDCDDMAFYAKKKLNELGYNTKRVYMMRWKYNGHADCFFTSNNEICLFNYGYIKKGNSLEECIAQLPRNYDLFKIEK